ncbi:MAG: hypothetical protein EOO39_30650, partial [Cytophagaceae bacterium]
MTLPTAADVKIGTSTFGDPASVVTPSYTPDFPLAANVRSNDTTDGVTGTVLDCGTEGAVGCVIVGPTYGAAILTGIESKILSGQSIGGVAGNVTLPAAGKVLVSTTYGTSGTGTTGTLTLPTAANVRAGSTDYGDPGSAVTPTYSPDFPLAANVRSNDTVNNVIGTLLDCTAGNQAGCVSTSTYKTMDLSLASGTIDDLTDATLSVALKSSSQFEYWTSTGVRQVSIGDTDISAANILSTVSIFGTTGSVLAYSPCASDGQSACITDSTFKAMNTTGVSSWDIRAGKTLGGISGAITFNSNLAQLSSFNRTSGTGASSSTTVADNYDLLDDFPTGTIPSELPSGAQIAVNNWLRDSLSDSNANGLCDGVENCVYKDQLTNLLWARDDGTSRNWEDGISYCINLSYGGYT